MGLGFEFPENFYSFAIVSFCFNLDGVNEVYWHTIFFSFFFSLLHAFVTLLTSTTTNWMMKQGPLASLISSSCRAMSADSALREMIFFRGCYIWWKMQETHIFLCVASFLCRGYGWRREYCVGIRPWRAIEITPIFLLFFFSSPGQYLCSAFIQHDGERCHDLF